LSSGSTAAGANGWRLVLSEWKRNQKIDEFDRIFLVIFIESIPYSCTELPDSRLRSSLLDINEFPLNTLIGAKNEK
jgi:hypothetical protein